MSNFKSGSGNLDFGGDGDTEKESETAATDSKTTERDNTPPSTTPEQTTRSKSDETADSDTASNRSSRDSKTTDLSESTSTPDEYPYFVRRNNVGDERDIRLEIHVREQVADQETEFRNEVAEHLGANEISKTDAREFALLVAFNHPEKVAELMRDEGFGTLG